MERGRREMEIKESQEIILFSRIVLRKNNSKYFPKEICFDGFSFRVMRKNSEAKKREHAHTRENDLNLV